MSLASPPVPPRARTKREQVVRACDWCRQHRVKCDNHIPCSHCRTRSRQCSNEALSDLSLPQAHREIERLKQKVRQLETELHATRERTSTDSVAAGASVSAGPDVNFSPGDTASDSDESCLAAAVDPRTPQSFWKGIHVRSKRSANETWYGPSSLFYFIGRMSTYLNSALQLSESTDHSLELNAASGLFDGQLGHSATRQRPGQEFAATKGEYMNSMKEGFYLEIYWQAYQTCLFPILDEADFMEYWQSLWTNSGNERNPSPLADIVIALCMQYRSAANPGTTKTSKDEASDPTLAGRWYYIRCQRLLAYDMESPSLSTMQCHLLCCIYLCCATFVNMADSAFVHAVRTAYMLGLHLEPPASMPEKERQLRMRLWWALYMLDCKIGMKLGRPFLVTLGTDKPSRPGDQLDVAMQSGSAFAPLGHNATWLTFNTWQVMLFEKVRIAHVAFYEKDLVPQEAKNIWSSSAALESHAVFLSHYMNGLDLWAMGVPSALKTDRADGGKPYSTDGSSLSIEPYAPVWVQRQRILLELVYHNLCINLYRPLISFVPTSHSAAAEEAAVKCSRHALTLTAITHQVLSTTSILTGWHEAFQWQWNAAMTLVGFALAYPQSPGAVAAREGIALTVTVFDLFSTSFAVAGSAAGVIRRLMAQTDMLARQAQERLAGSRMDNVTMAQSASGNSQLWDQLHGAWPSDLNSGKVFNTTGQDIGTLPVAAWQDVFDVAFDIDQWTDMDMLWPVGESALAQISQV